MVERVSLLAAGDPAEFRRIMDAPAANDGPSAKDLLEQQKPAQSFLAALDNLRPAARTPLMSGIWPSRAGDGTADAAVAE